MTNGDLKPDNIFRQTLFGVPAVQRWVDLWLWEQVFEQSPQIRGVIELGTLKGGLSQFLLMQAVARGLGFATLDREDYLFDTPLIRALNLRLHWLHCDMWTPEGRQAIGAMLDDDAWHPLLLLCDGGNKPKEVQTFAPLLRAGDIIAVHDWNTEFGPGDLTPVEHLLVPYLIDLYESVESMTRWW